MSEIIPFKKPIKPQDLVLRFMTSTGHKHDAEVYLKLFSSQRPESFAIIVLESDVLKEELDTVLFEIRYLTRLGLFPVVVIHASDEELDHYDVTNYFKKAKLAVNFLSEDFSQDERLEFIRERVQNQLLPLLHFDLSYDFTAELTKLANLLNAGKIVFLKKRGGVYHQEKNSLVSIVNLRFEYQELLNSPHITAADKEFLKACHSLIESCHHKMFLAMVSPNNLLRELFTVKGAGTLVQIGSKIKTDMNWKSIDPKSLKRLLELSFERKIKDGFFQKTIDHFYIEENYMGAALLQDYQDMTYLSKFAVGTEARGLGIGRDLWSEIVKNHQKIFWRSNPKKFITNWYIKQCDGMHKTGDWTVFWKGLNPSEITNCVEYALSQEVDFVE